MEKRILLAVDGSEKGLKAVYMLGHFLKDQPDVKLVLFHCVQQLASLLPGDVCLGVEESCRLPFKAQENMGNQVLDAARQALQDAGFPFEQTEARLKIDSIDQGQDILAEAAQEGIGTIALGRRGRSQIETLLLGSVSSKVAQYARRCSVWVVDTPVHQTQSVLMAMADAADARTLSRYAAEYLAPVPDLEYTLLHLIPPIPPTFWDDGHILSPAEQKGREARIDSWRADWTRNVDRYMSEARSILVESGVPDQKIKAEIIQTKEGVARDLLNEIAAHQFQMVVIGKRSFKERKPFLIGSHANKVIQNAKGAIVCMVEA